MAAELRSLVRGVQTYVIQHMGGLREALDDGLANYLIAINKVAQLVRN